MEIFYAKGLRDSFMGRADKIALDSFLSQERRETIENEAIETNIS